MALEGKRTKPMISGSGCPYGHLGTPRDTTIEGVNMKLLDDAQIAADAEKRAGYRLRGVTTKLSPSEVDSVERLARSRGLQRGELIRKLILDELARDSGSEPASTELIEIMGIRLMLTNLFRPLATGQKLTPEAFDNMVAEVKKRKRSVAEDALQDLERA